MKNQRLSLVPSLTPEAPPTPETLLTIGQLAKQCQTTVRTLRYYEEMQLIAPTTRSQAGYRLYNTSVLGRIHTITTLQALNYTLDEVLDLIGSAAANQQPTSRQQRLQHTQQTLLAQQASLQQKQAELTQLQAQITERLHLINSICTPCQEAPHANHPIDGCTQCNHKAIHWQ
jgi:DNA-binding transcriptional MerR regulator